MSDHPGALTDAELRLLTAELRQHGGHVEHMGLEELASAVAMHIPPLGVVGDDLKDMKDHRGNAVRVPVDSIVLPKGEQGHNCHCHGKDHNCKIVLRICHQPEHVWCIKFLIEFFNRWHAEQAEINSAGAADGSAASFTGLLHAPSLLGSGQQRSLIPFCPLCREICHCQKPCLEPPCVVCCSRPKNKTRKKDYRKRKAEEALNEAHAAKHAAVADPHGLAAQAMAGLWGHMPTSSAQLQQLSSMGLLPPHLLQHQQVLAAQAGGMVMPQSPQSALDEYQQRAAAAAAGAPWLGEPSSSGGGGSVGKQQQQQQAGFSNLSMAAVLQAMMPGYHGLLQISQDGQLMLVDTATADPNALPALDSSALAGGALGGDMSLGGGAGVMLGGDRRDGISSGVGMMEGQPGSPGQMAAQEAMQQANGAAGMGGQYAPGMNSNVLQSLYSSNWPWSAAGGQMASSIPGIPQTSGESPPT